MKEKKLTHDIENKNVAKMCNENVIKSELLPFCYDDSSLAWCVRDILEHSKMINNSELDIDCLFNESELFSTLMDSKWKMFRKPLSDTISFSRKSYFNSIFLEHSDNEEMKIFLRNFNQFSKLSNLLFDYPLISNSILSVLKNRKDDWCDIELIEILEKDGKANDINLFDKIMELYYKLIDFCTEFNSDAFESLLRYYFELSGECVFNPGNINLNNTLFRKSKTLETLYCIGKIPFQNSDTKKKEGYAYYNICSPYVAGSLLRTVNTLKILINKNSVDCLDLIPELKKLRTEIFINKMVKSFMRFTTYNNSKTYKVTLNRHNGELLSIPYNELSSIVEVKPLHLFEKIISHIYFRIRELFEKQNNKPNDICGDILTVNVGVIGHAEVSYSSSSGDSMVDACKKEYREIYDLLRMTVDWYNRIANFGKIKAPKLDLRITYFVNDSDVLFSRSLDIADSEDDCAELITGQYGVEDGNIGRFYVRKCSYYKDFNFSKRKLRDIITQNDISFVLDCPWITEESYELLKGLSLLSYCNHLNSRKYKIRNDKLLLNSDKSTELQYLNVQYNRIISSDTVCQGYICRVFKDSYLRAIKDTLKTEESNSLRKEVYVFTSEKEGWAYSYLGSYPLFKKEMYGDKAFSIAHFLNRKSTMLELAKDGRKSSFYIRLWSIFKYIAVSYASVYFREEIDRVFSGYSLLTEDYFELMRAIIVKLTLSSDLNKVFVSMGYDESVMEKIKESLNIGDNDFGMLKCKLQEHLKPFIKALYEVIFSDNEAFGYDTIRTAFEMNMYDSAKDVESMFFIHIYKNKRMKKRISDFDVELNLEKYDSFNNIEQELCFRDKRIYEMLFQVLEKTHRFNIGMNASLYKGQEIYGCNDIEKVLLQNVDEVCRKTKKTDTEIYRNTVTALSEF